MFFAQSPDLQFTQFNNLFNSKHNLILDALNLGSKLIAQDVTRLQIEFGTHLPNIDGALSAINPKFEILFNETLISTQKIAQGISVLIAHAKRLKTEFALDLPRVAALDEKIAHLGKLLAKTENQKRNIEIYQTQWHHLSENLALCSRKPERELRIRDVAAGLDFLNSAGILDPEADDSTIDNATLKAAAFMQTQCGDRGVSRVAHAFVEGWKTALPTQQAAATPQLRM